VRDVIIRTQPPPSPSLETEGKENAQTEIPAAVGFTGKREALWRGEYREYYLDADGKEQSRHKSKPWSRANYTKAEAQAGFDALLLEQQQGGPKRDGSMTLRAFWEQVYYPVRSRKWAFNSRKQVSYLWKRHIKPALGGKALNQIVKSDIDLHLVKLSDAGTGSDLVSGVLKWIHSMLEEALDNDFIGKNPARKIQVPVCKPKPEARSLMETEIRALWEKTDGRDYLIWRVLVLTGARIGELFALTRSDLLPNGLVIDESALQGRPSTTKNKKPRLVPIPAALRAELEDWLASHNYALMFPTATGRMHRRSSERVQQIVDRARTAAKIPDLTFRMCRTTFATMFDGDIRDVQEILGHHSAAFTLQIYRKPMTTRQQQAVDAMESRLKVVPIKKGAA